MINFNEKIYRIMLGEMSFGDTFIYENEPFMKVCLENEKNTFINLLTGEEVCFRMDDEYEPIDFELKRVKKENA